MLGEYMLRTLAIIFIFSILSCSSENERGSLLIEEGKYRMSYVAASGRPYYISESHTVTVEHVRDRIKFTVTGNIESEDEPDFYCNSLTWMVRLNEGGKARSVELKEYNCYGNATKLNATKRDFSASPRRYEINGPNFTQFVIDAGILFQTQFVRIEN